jgi:hypothetical protein
MDTNPASLLKLLGAGVRPDGASPPKGAAPMDAASFGDLLARVRGGSVSSGEPIHVGPHAGVALTRGQLDRLSRVTDAAEAAGATRLLAFIDGQALTVDVLTRTVEAGAEQLTGKVVTDIDAVVMVPDDPLADLASLFSGGADAPAPARGRGWLPGLAGVSNPDVARLLSDTNPDGEPHAAA